MHIRQEEVCLKMEFYLNIYFAIFVIHPSSKLPQTEAEQVSAMESFKQFLDHKGLQLSKTAEFLSFYALPYISDPSSHPSFQKLFTLEWIQELRQKFIKFMDHFLPPMDTPMLLKMYSAYSRIRRGVSANLRGANISNISQGVGAGAGVGNSGASGVLGPNNPNIPGSESDVSGLLDTEANNIELIKEEYGILREQYDLVIKREEYTKNKLLESQAKWTMFAQDILGIGKELFKAVNTLHKGDPVPPEFLQGSKAKIDKYETFLLHNAMEFKINRERDGGILLSREEGDPDRSNTAITEELRNDVSSLSMFNQKSYMDEGTSQTEIASLAPLRYTKIKHFLLTGEEELQICALLQALRWRVTRSKHGHPRKHVLHSYIHYDLLDCKGVESYICTHLLKHENRK